VKTAPGLGREEGLTVPTPPGPRTRDTLVAGVGGLIDEEEADEDDDPEYVDIHCTLLHYYSYSIMAQYTFLHA